MIIIFFARLDELGEAGGTHAILRHLNTWAPAKEGLTASLTDLKRGILWDL